MTEMPSDMLKTAAKEADNQAVKEQNGRNPLVIAPSVLSMDYSRMKEQLTELEESRAEWIHFDVMDGHFVPNLTFGPDLLKGFDKRTDLFLDVHLMVDNPGFFAPVFIHAGADMITFHTEALNNDPFKIGALLEEIHKLGAKAGFTVKPETPIEPFEPLLECVDMILIMSVKPGFGGQSFMEKQLDKVRWLDSKRKEKGLHYRIEVDGGINDQTAPLAKEAGADTLVAGSYVFKNGIVDAVESLF